MRILIVGDYPGFSGGVTNYTRPLADELAKSNEVFYLFNNSRLGRYYIGGPRIKKYKSKTNYLIYELLTGKGLEKNYDQLLTDVNYWFDRKFIKIIKEIQPEVIHINEIFGFSSNIISIAQKYKIKVVVTVHEYWWLCPHRVMVDFNGQICAGPYDIKKCSFCVAQKLKSYNTKYIKLRYILKNQFQLLYKILTFIKKLIRSGSETPQLTNLDFLNISFLNYMNARLENQLKIRLEKNIGALNICDKIICVSEDVKNNLIKYNVQPGKLLVQHIGSTIADQSVVHKKALDKENLVFGFIGGISYYKGVHQFVDAFTRMPDSYKQKATLKLYGKYDENYLYTIKETILKNELYKDNVMFFGRYSPSDIENITNTIDIMVLPSLCADTASQTIFESFSCQIPIIAPKIGGFPDFVKDDINGLLYNSASVESLRNKLMYILDNPDKISEFRNQIPKLKTIPQNCVELVELFNSI
jgi:glycosyltransferase involved in cell wall biosynthesis